jgi:hypothetical protein
MAGTISFYDAKGNRQHTIYLGATPEYGKAEFLRRFTAEIERVKAHFPNAKRVGLADGAESNWQFLTPHTQTQRVRPQFYDSLKKQIDIILIF